MMVRRYCDSNEQINFFGRSNRSSMPPHLSREGVRSFAMPNRSLSPNHHDSEDDKSENPPRRRIALACSRCRKRKIKCSGDIGNGQGCQNCKNAGTEPGTCQFLRVNSTTTYYSPTHSVSWPYSGPDTMMTTSAIARGSNVGHYPLQNGGMLPSSGVSAGFHPNSTQFVRQSPLNNQPGITYSPIHSRQPYPSNYAPGFGDDSFDQFTMSAAPQYLLPLQDLHTSASGYSTPDGSRGWTPIAMDNRAPLGNPTFDHDPVIRCGPPTYSYMNSSGSSVSSVATDGSSTFPAMGSLATSLPPHAANNSRTLPDPTSKKPSTINNNVIGQRNPNESSLATVISPSPNYRFSLSWDQEHIAAGENQTPTSSSSLSTVGAIDRTSTKSSTSPRGPQESSSYACFPLAHAPLTTNVPSLSEYLPATMPESTTAGDNNQPGSSNTSFSTALSNDVLLSSQTSSPSLYGYSMGNGARNNSISDSMASDGTLASGLPYTHLRQPQSQSVPTFETSRRNSLESSRSTHRTSISSINNGINSGRY